MESKLSLARLGIGVVLALLLVGACGKAASNSSGSNTNWLEPCDTTADCGSGFECWCNVCAAPCAVGAACEQPGASCRASTSLGCAEAAASASLCVAGCETSVDCHAFGAAFSCVNAACVVAENDTPGAGGSDGAGGSAAVRPAGVGAIAVGADQRCLTSDGRLYCWGLNTYGQAGGDPMREASEVHLLSEVHNAVEVAAGNYHTCALTSDGDVYCWGYNADGEIGTESAAEGTCPDYVLDKPGDYACQPTPTRVAAVSGARHVAVGDGRSCAVLADDTITCWGNVASISTWVAGALAPEGLALGPSGACAVTPEGALSCSSNAVELEALHDIKTLVLGGGGVNREFGCALGTAGDVHCWGDDAYGQLGQPDAASLVTNPINDVSQIVATSAGACALSFDGSVWCWGKNSWGEAGLSPLASPNCGTETCEGEPHRVENLPRATKLAAGGNLTCAVVEDAAVWCWGLEFLRTAGAAKRIPGPWEGGDQACVAQAQGAAQELVDMFVTTNTHYCETDQDCTSLALDLPCLHSCESVPISKADSTTFTTAIASLSRRYCDAAPDSCAAHEVSCSASSDVNACIGNACTRLNLERSGCTDACSCQAERSVADVVARDDCAGPDLWIVFSEGCKSCGAGGAWVVVGNRGDSQFSGTATLSFESIIPENAALVPAARALELTLAPGEVTKPLYVESLGEVHTRSRITGAGDCAPQNDTSSEVTFPAAQNCQ